jgi:hypothetical protein
MKKTLTGLLFLLVSSAYANNKAVRFVALEDSIVTITNSVPGNEDFKVFLKVGLNADNKIVSFVKETISHATSKVLNVESFAADEIYKGITLESSKHPLSGDTLNIVQIISSNVDESYGGDITVKYLYNGLRNDYKTKDFELAYQGQEWSLMEKGGNVVDGLHLKPNKKAIIGVVGIKEIVTQ